MVYLKNTQYLFTNNNSLPINNENELINFIAILESQTDPKYNTLQNALNGLKAIRDKSWSQETEKHVLQYNSVYYYRVYSSLFTETYHNTLKTENEFFKTLHLNATNTNVKKLQKLNSVQNNAQDATQNWENDAAITRFIRTITCEK